MPWTLIITFITVFSDGVSNGLEHIDDFPNRESCLEAAKIYKSETKADLPKINIGVGPITTIISTVCVKK